MFKYVCIDMISLIKSIVGWVQGRGVWGGGRDMSPPPIGDLGGELLISLAFGVVWSDFLRLNEET